MTMRFKTYLSLNLTMTNCNTTSGIRALHCLQLTYTDGLRPNNQDHMWYLHLHESCFCD